MDLEKLGIKDPSGVIGSDGINQLLLFISRLYKDVYTEAPSFSHTNITDGVIDGLFEKKLIKPGIRVLDAGCGMGPALEKFRSLGIEAEGITMSQDETEYLSERKFLVHRMDFSFPKFEPHSFDFVWARHILEHSPFPYFTLNQFNLILKNESLLYIEVPQANSPFKHESNYNHYSVLGREMLESLIERSGFEIIDEYIFDLEGMNKEEEHYYGYLCRKIKDGLLAFEIKKEKEKLFLALSKGENFGWGVCSKYLNQEVSKLYENMVQWDFSEEGEIAKQVDGTVFHALTGFEFESISKIRGKRNIGYTFFENELNEVSVKNAAKYDLVLGGSTWNLEKLREKGIMNSEVLIQGIDPLVFFPGQPKNDNELFVIFSGGKFELRKGQDLVIKAVGIMQQRHPDVVLINAWYNMWPKSMELMSVSKHIDFKLRGDAQNWSELMNNLCADNGMDPSRVISLNVVPNKELRDIYLNTDIGLFPNRCEGGTNLVLMEYMASGRSVIASYNTGHKDVLNDLYSYRLMKMNNFRLSDSGGNIWADWYEPDLEEILEKLETAYSDRSQTRKKGVVAGEIMKQFTWKNSAHKLLEVLGIEPD